MKIEIVNWTRFNPRADVKRSSWFRMEHSFLTSPKIFSLPNEAKLVWIGCLCEAARKQSFSILIDIYLFSALLKIDDKTVINALNSLQDLEMIKIPTVRGRPANGTGTLRERTATYERTNVRDETNETNVKLYTVKNDDQINDPESAQVMIKKKAQVMIEESDLAVGTEWFEFASDMMPWKKIPKSWTPETFAVAIRDIKKKTDLNDFGVKALLDFIRGDIFWSKNAFSPFGLLKAKNGVRKIDNILVRMKPSSEAQQDKLLQWAKGE